ncbi:hypothetical protein, partial [Escherichia coli]|uniref:hypothetical protein n=1 Tax=Escherichia coli TaxID=562 RepID=UPI0032E4C55D
MKVSGLKLFCMTLLLLLLAPSAARADISVGYEDRGLGVADSWIRDENTGQLVRAEPGTVNTDPNE